jgi:hypothetical protein
MVLRPASNGALVGLVCALCRANSSMQLLLSLSIAYWISATSALSKGPGTILLLSGI